MGHSAPPNLTPVQKTSPYILPATGTADDVSSAVPYGIYTGSVDFCSGAATQVAFTYRMLGGDVLDIELTAENVYAAYETSVLEYSYIINNHQAKNVLSSLLGASTGSFDQRGELKTSGYLSQSLSGTHLALKYPKFRFEYSKRVADGLGAEAAVGDDSRIYSGSITLRDSVQDYDLQDIANDVTGAVSNKRVAIRRVYYKSPTSMWRFYGYYGGLNVVGNLYTYGQYSDESTFEVVPAWQNKLQSMAFETNLYTRASHYAYEIRDNRIRLYPPPSEPGTGSPNKVWFEFTIPQDPWEEDPTREDGVDGINNVNTLPFANIPYENINSMGKQWIRKYALAIAKEMLSQIRGKFASVPIPGDSVTLNASELSAQAKSEQETLKTELKELLDSLTYSAMVDSDAKLSEDANRLQVNIPIGVYIG